MDKSNIRIVRLNELNKAAGQLLEEYYEAVQVMLRDTPQELEVIVHDLHGGLWLAYLNREPVGCVVLRSLASVPLAAECKRLYVQPAARGQGIADKLLNALEEYAREQGLQWIYLDSYDDLESAIALYRKRGYVPCERYNENSQATVFLRKWIGR